MYLKPPVLLHLSNHVILMLSRERGSYSGTDAVCREAGKKVKAARQCQGNGIPEHFLRYSRPIRWAGDLGQGSAGRKNLNTIILRLVRRDRQIS